MGEVVDLRDQRLRRIRVAEGVLVERRVLWAETLRAKSALVDELKRWEVAVETARATSTPMPESTPEGRARLVVATRARSEFDRVRSDYAEAHNTLTHAIGDAVATQQLQLGDPILTPFRIVHKRGPLIVAQFRYPPAAAPEEDRRLGEVTLSEDGLPIENRRHNASSDEELDGFELIAFERWWGGGVRVGGRVHAITRRLIDTE